MTVSEIITSSFNDQHTHLAFSSYHEALLEFECKYNK